LATGSEADTGAGQRVPPSAGTPGGPGGLLLSDLLDRQPLLVAINLMVALVAGPILALAAPPALVAAWLAAMLLVQGGRVALWLVARRGWPTSAGHPRLGPWLTLTSAVAGLSWGAAGALFGSSGSPVAMIFVPFLLSGMSAGAVTALTTYPPSFFAFVWAALLPYAARLAAEPDATSRTMAGIVLLYAAGVSMVGYQVHRTLRRAAELHLQNATLVHRLDEARQGLEATVAHRTLELQAANDSLSREVVERRRSEERVRHVLAHDPLTGLPNRLLLFDRLGQALAHSRRFGTKTAVMVFDVDRFKAINDTFGHPTGDRLLRELERRVRGAIRATDTAARIGGDEFALVAPDLADARLGLTLADRLLDACRVPFDVGDARLQVSISLGAALFPEHGQDPDTLLRAADAALYDAKGNGRDRIGLYSQAMHASLQERRRLEVELRQAPARRQLRLAYQPRFAIADRRLMGVEALLRWDHPEFGTLPTNQFIAVAEANGSIRDLGGWVLDAACEQGRRWRDAGHRLRVAVNLSAVEFREPGLSDRIGRALARVRLEPELLELEITESACMDREGETLESGVAEIKRLGVRLAIDDFGTGWSSLAYLKWLPFDVLKVDRAFVRNLDGDPRDEAIVTTIVTLARHLEKIVVAEGVENQRQLDALGRLGCHEAQGFLLGRPSRPEAIDALLAAAA
jgi:diguanylate cyclase (GGDEF)-like protein